MSRLSHKQKLYIIVGIAAVAVVLQYLLHLKLYAQILVTLVGAIIALSMFKEMIHTLRSGKYGVDLLAILAVVATLSVGEYWASMVILIMLTGGDTLEDYASHKANTELKALLDNSPQIAHKIMDDGDIDDVSVNDVKVGDKIVVKPGEIVPVDSFIIKGSGLFGQLPQSKDMGLVTHDLTVSGNNATSLLPHYTWLHHWVVGSTHLTNTFTH